MNIKNPFLVTAGIVGALSFLLMVMLAPTRAIADENSYRPQFKSNRCSHVERAFESLYSDLCVPFQNFKKIFDDAYVRVMSYDFNVFNGIATPAGSVRDLTPQEVQAYVTERADFLIKADRDKPDLATLFGEKEPPSLTKIATLNNGVQGTFIVRSGSSFALSFTDPETVVNATEGENKNTAMYLVFSFGKCVFDYKGFETEEGISTKAPTYGLEHLPEPVAATFARNHKKVALQPPQHPFYYKLINSHPMSEHDLEPQLEQFMIEFGNTLMDDWADTCGMKTTTGAPTETPTQPSMNLAEPYATVKRILDTVPLPEIPDGVTYPQCGQLCSAHDGIGYHGRLLRACDGNESLLREVYGVAECSTAAYQRMSACWSDLCGLIRILAGPTDGSGSAILRLDEIEKTTGVPLEDVINREPSLLDIDFERLREDTGMGRTPIDIDFIYYDAKTGETLGKFIAFDVNDPGGENRTFGVSPFGENTYNKRILIPVDIADSPKKSSPTPKSWVRRDGVLIQGDPSTSLEADAERLGRLVNEDRVFQMELLRGKLEVLTEEFGKIKLRVPQGEITNDGTHFRVQVTDEGHTVVGVYKGEVKLTSLVTGEEITIVPENGKPGIAGLRFFTPEEFNIIEPEKESGVWSWILIIAVTGGIGYFSYRNKEKIIAAFKKPKADINN
ncbi:MAG: FecR family protein [bacterium]|nr:FecR family protein [bacterium]